MPHLTASRTESPRNSATLNCSYFCWARVIWFYVRLFSLRFLPVFHSSGSINALSAPSVSVTSCVAKTDVVILIPDCQLRLRAVSPMPFTSACSAPSILAGVILVSAKGLPKRGPVSPPCGRSGHESRRSETQNRAIRSSGSSLSS
jgi:hypothetical protein